MLQTHLNVSQNGENSKTETTHVAYTCLFTLLTNCQNYLIQVIDFSASTHICHDKSIFIVLRSAQNMYVILPTKTRLTVEFLGDIFITKDEVLRDVLYIPFQYNLLSVSAFLKHKNTLFSFLTSIASSRRSCFRKQLEMLNSSMGFTYSIYQEKDKSCSIKHTTLICKASTSIWHKRLGHPINWSIKGPITRARIFLFFEM